MSASNRKGSFTLKQVTPISDIVEGKCGTLPESDLCFQNEQHVLQFEYKRPEESSVRVTINPGIFTLTESQLGINVEKIELRSNELLETINNTHMIIKEAKTFFSRLHVYETLKRPKKRGVLLYSLPGMGKSSAVSKFCRDFVAEDPGTVVINWPTSEIESDRVAKFLSLSSEYTDKCTRLILIIEDIGGGERENGGAPNRVDSGLLNLLDGVNVTFKLPTFIVATTNHPENLLDALANRPGRFDLMMELQPPSYDEKIALLEFIAKRPLTDDEKQAFQIREAQNFSIAHLEEVVVRSLLHDRSIPDVVNELAEHYNKFKRGFEKDRSMGIV